MPIIVDLGLEFFSNIYRKTSIKRIGVYNCQLYVNIRTKEKTVSQFTLWLPGLPIWTDSEIYQSRKKEEAMSKSACLFSGRGVIIPSYSLRPPAGVCYYVGPFFWGCFTGKEYSVLIPSTWVPKGQYTMAPATGWTQRLTVVLLSSNTSRTAKRPYTGEDRAAYSCLFLAV